MTKSFTVGFLLGVLCLGAATGAEATVRPPAVAGSGSFYPADSAELAKLVAGHLNRVTDSPKIDGELVALIVPHAGLVYSGAIAAHSYKLLEGRPVRNVVLCGPSHRFPFRGVSVYGPSIEWKTPLGVVPCSDDLCNQLMAADPRIGLLPQAQVQEHCLEVQLPYLQTVLHNFKIVPLIMGQQDTETVDLLAKALSGLELGGHTILVSATDWQHYKPAAEGWKFDSLGLDCVQRLDPDRLQKYLDQGRVEACGGGPTVAVLRAAIAHGANKVKILKYGDSGDVTGDKSQVVGYLAAAIYKSGEVKKGVEMTPHRQEQEAAPSLASLTDDEKRQLLTIARQSIEGYLTNDRPPEFSIAGKLALPGAAFVTLQEHEQLRGCIGYTEAVRPLYQTVSECAIQAAVSDPRFMPVTADEVDELEIEISVLTPLQKVGTLDEIQVNRDGLMIFKGNHRGLLLPQVATDYGWDRTQFLEQTCRKAGLPPDAYKSPDATIYRFQALVFGETEK